MRPKRKFKTSAFRDQCIVNSSNKLSELRDILKYNNVDVSTAQLIRAFEYTTEIKPESVTEFKEIIRNNTVSHEHDQIFDISFFNWMNGINPKCNEELIKDEIEKILSDPKNTVQMKEQDYRDEFDDDYDKEDYDDDYDEFQEYEDMLDDIDQSDKDYEKSQKSGGSEQQQDKQSQSKQSKQQGKQSQFELSEQQGKQFQFELSEQQNIEQEYGDINPQDFKGKQDSSKKTEQSKKKSGQKEGKTGDDNPFEQRKGDEQEGLSDKGMRMSGGGDADTQSSEEGGGGTQGGQSFLGTGGSQQSYMGQSGSGGGTQFSGVSSSGSTQRSKSAPRNQPLFLSRLGEKKMRELESKMANINRNHSDLKSHYIKGLNKNTPCNKSISEILDEMKIDVEYNDQSFDNDYTYPIVDYDLMQYLKNLFKEESNDKGYHSKSKKIDLNKTISHSKKTYGKITKLIRQRKKDDSYDSCVVFLDISGSMRRYIQPILSLASISNSMQNCRFYGYGARMQPLRKVMDVDFDDYYTDFYTSYKDICNKELINPNDNVLIISDFSHYGNTNDFINEAELFRDCGGKDSKNIFQITTASDYSDDDERSRVFQKINNISNNIFVSEDKDFAEAVKKFSELL
jgi:hypothetical protein